MPRIQEYKKKEGGGAQIVSDGGWTKYMVLSKVPYNNTPVAAFFVQEEYKR